MVFTEVHQTVWIALIILVFSLFYKILLFASSSTYRRHVRDQASDSPESAALPNTMLLTSLYYKFQPSYYFPSQVVAVPDPLRYIMIYVAAITSCVFILISMQCSITGNCNTYAWIYVGFLAFMFVLIMSRMLYDFAAWRQMRNRRRYRK